MKYIAAISVLIFMVACGGDDENTCDDSLDTLKLGMVIAISGDTSIGEAWQGSARLAASDVNAEGGVDGRCVELVVRDSQDNVATALSEADDLVENEGVLGLIFQTSTDTGAFLANFGDEGYPRVPVFCAGCTAPDFDLAPLPEAEGAPLLWRMTESNVRQGTDLANLAREEGHTTAGYLVVDVPFGTGFATAFTQAFEAADGPGEAGEVIHEYTHSATDPDQAETDIGNAITAVATTPPDVFVIHSLPEGNIGAMDGFATAGEPCDLMLSFTSGAADVLDSVTLSSESKNGILGVSYGTGKGQGGADFISRLESEQGEAILFSDMYYDAVMLFSLAAAASGGDVSRASIQENLSTLNDSGGTVVKYQEFGAGRDAVTNGDAINYEGVSGSLDFDTESNNAVVSPLIRWGVTGGDIVELQ